MANPFDSRGPTGDPRMEQQAKDNFGKLKRDLLRVHPDNHPKGVFGEEIFNESENLTKELSSLILRIEEENISWASKLARLNHVKNQKQPDIDRFFEKVERKKEENGRNGKDEERKMNPGEFRDKFGAYFRKPNFDSEGNAFYFDENGFDKESGQVKIKVTANGTGIFEEKIMGSVQELEQLIQDILVNKTKTLREIFNLTSQQTAEEEKKNKEQKENDEAAEFDMADRIKKEQDQDQDERFNNYETQSNQEDLENNDNGPKVEGEDDKLSELKLAVEEARKRYVAKDFEVNNSIGNIKKTLGQWMKITPENVTDTQTFYNQYKIALNELKDYQLEQIKGKNLSPEETKRQLGEIIKYFNFNEKSNLYQSRVEIRDSVKKDRTSEKIIQGISKSISWYRKLPAKYKIALSVGLFLGAAGAGMAGAAGAASFFGAARVAQRIVGGAAAGVGMTGLQEGLRRRWDEKKSQKEIEETLKNFETESGSLEEKIRRIGSKLEGEIGTYQRELQRERRKSFSRKVWGASVGIFIGSGTMAYAMKELGVSEYLSKTGKSAKEFLGTTNLMPEGGSTGAHEEAIKKVPGAKVLEPEKPKIPSGETYTENSLGSSREVPKTGGIEQNTEVLPYQSDETISGPQENIKLSVDKWEKGKLGGSFEGTLKKHLMEKGMSRTEAGKVAHRMFLDFEKEHPAPKGFSYQKIQPGAQIEIGKDGKILSFNDGPKSKWTESLEEKSKIKSPLEGKRTGAPGKSLEYEEGNRKGEKIIKEKETYPRRGRSRILERGEAIEVKEKHIETEEDLSGRKESVKIIPQENPAGRAPTLEIKKPLIREINFSGAEDLNQSGAPENGRYNFSWSDSLDERAIKTMKFISMEDRANWNQMKGLSFDEIKSGMSKDVSARVENLRKIYEGELGSEANPRRKETIFNWIRRTMKLAEDEAKNYRSI